ncbi:lysophospholipid acyltransferase family protein [Wukongibacter baidiensis]|uniref:lysophospholipid acyltransferase family protein n=1 Tax=Wukongibacter baidiensis TaxID=1723361 RepID=UPI003D7F400C
MFRTITWIIYFIFRILILTPKLMKVKSLDKQNMVEEKDKLAYSIAKSWGRDLVKRSGSKVTVVGEENIPENEAVLFVSNHQSNLDIPILLGFIDKPKAFVAKIELSKFPVLSTWMKLINCIFIDRGNARESLKAIKAGIKLLKGGYSLVIFPEGTRSKDGNLMEFKPGSLKLATKSGVPIVPVTINGAKDIMPSGKLAIRPANVELVISKPIYMDDEVAKDSNALTETVRNIIDENLKKN